MIHGIATLGFVGFLRPAPGTWGSLAAFPLAWAVHTAGGPWLFLGATVVLFFLGTWAAERYMAASGRADPSEVVVDEVVGQWIALWPVSIGAAHSGAALSALWPGLLAAFLFFRAFDILKPGPVGWAETLPGGWGVMADDVVAGWIACLCVAVAAFVAHGVLGL